MILFLDFDGVLHHYDVILDMDDGTRHPVSRRPERLFSWATELSEALIPFPDVSLVLSTKWVWWFGLPYCRSAMPPSLSARVIGATWEGSWAMPEGWIHLPRCEQIRLHVRRYGIEDWIALDDDGAGLSDEDADRDRFVICDSERGVSDATVIDALVSTLCPKP